MQCQMADSIRRCALKPLPVLSCCLQKVIIGLLAINMSRTNVVMLLGDGQATTDSLIMYFW